MRDTQILDVCLVMLLSRCIVGAQVLLRVCMVHLIVGSPGIVFVVNSSGRVHSDPSFIFAEEETNGGEEQPLHKPPDPLRKTAVNG